MPTLPELSILALSILLVPKVMFPASLLFIVNVLPDVTKAIPSVAALPVVEFVSFISEAVELPCICNEPHAPD
jgi:hypothetical protein